MRNDECIIYFITKRGSKQVYKKDKKGWTQKSSRGIVRRLTAEQFLSHLLPGLTNEYKEFTANANQIIKTIVTHFWK